MIYTNLTNRELILHVDNNLNATPLERELAERLGEVSMEVGMVEATLLEMRGKLNSLRTSLDND